MSRPKNLETKIDLVDDVLKSIQELAKRQVLVGIPSNAAGRNDGPMNSAAIGYILETGAPERNLPARPFLVPTIWRIRADLGKRAKAALYRVTSGKPGAKRAVEHGLGGIGLLAANEVKRVINAGDFAPLAPSTLYARKHRKSAPRNSEKPLVDTGQLRNAVTYVIRRK